MRLSADLAAVGELGEYMIKEAPAEVRHRSLEDGVTKWVYYLGIIAERTEQKIRQSRGPWTRLEMTIR